MRPGPIVEVIACSVSDAIEAERGGAGRLEIVRDFERGGLTPPVELVQKILDAVTLPVRVMLREGERYDVTSNAEKDRLCAVAGELAALGVNGVVLGFLSRGQIDVQLTEQILACAPNLGATFHHAFEDAEDHLTAIRVLKGVKQVDRILASGGNGGLPEKIKRLSRYQKEAGPEIVILAGGGMDQQAIQMVRKLTTIREFHVGRAAREPVSVTGDVRSERVRALVETANESV